MTTKSKTDEEVLEMVTERLVDGFEGIKKLFQTNDPSGEESITHDALLQIMYNTIGYISKERFDRLMKNLGLDKKEKISFDMFVSRFKEFGDIQKQWTAPLKKEAWKERAKKAHPEEELRDCDIHEWGELQVAPQATHQLMKALRQKKIDFRSILPDDCFQPDGVVTKVQLRTALQEMGVNLTNQEYKRFWERYDRANVGYLPLEQLYPMMNLDVEGEPLSASPKTRTPISLKPITGTPPQNPAIAARKFYQGRHKLRGDPNMLRDGIRGEAILSPSADRRECSPNDVEDETEGKQSPAAEAAACSKIRAVMSQKPQGKFDCLIDCLHHKFEEHFVNMNMAFKLFDIHNDGSVMRIDFRRVLGEYGFPITALQLAPFISRLSMSINHGLVSYRQVLSKLMNRTDHFTSHILDDYIKAVRGGSSTEGANSDSEEETIVRRLVEYLHRDYVQLLGDILRCDGAGQGVVTVEELRRAVERCLGHSASENQWTTLHAKLPCDPQGKVRYADFLATFDKGEPGAWNQLAYGIVTVPRNKVVNKPSAQVERLQKAKNEGDPKPTVTREHREMGQLRQELKEFFTEKLHVVDKRFKELDRKSHKRFSKWQFGTILKLCGFPMTEKELTDLWLTMKVADDNMSTFNAVVMEFAPNFTPFHGNQHDKGEQEVTESKEKGSDAGSEQKAVPHQDTHQEEDKEKDEEEGKEQDPLFSPRMYLAHIVAKAQPAVRKNWEYLRQGFRNRDPHGLGSVSFKQMQRLLDGLRCGLSPEERDQLCSQYDFKRIGRCNYLAFMKTFSEPPPDSPRLIYAPHRHTLLRKPQDATKPITVSEALRRVRDKLMKHWKNLRRGFQKNDRSRSGYLSVLDFKSVLAECRVPVSKEDLFYILSEFDSNMDGRISYSEFLDALLRMG